MIPDVSLCTYLKVAAVRYIFLADRVSTFNVSTSPQQNINGIFEFLLQPIDTKNQTQYDISLYLFLMLLKL